MKSFFATFFFCLFFLFVSQAQNKNGLYWGLRIGAYSANNKQADFYNGKQSEQSNLETLIEQSYYYDKIAEYYNDDFSIYSQTPIMKYNPTVTVGGLLHYFITTNLAVYTQVSLVQLQGLGVFQIQLASPVQGTQLGTNIKNGSIHAKEQRFMLDFGLQHTFENKKTYKPYIMGGMSILSMQVIEHTFSIANVEGTFSYYNAQATGNSYFSTFAYGPQIGLGFQVPVQKGTVYIGGEFDYISFQHQNDGFTLQSKLICKIEM